MDEMLLRYLMDRELDPKGIASMSLQRAQKLIASQHVADC